MQAIKMDNKQSLLLVTDLLSLMLEMWNWYQSNFINQLLLYYNIAIDLYFYLKYY